MVDSDTPQGQEPKKPFDPARIAKIRAALAQNAGREATFRTEAARRQAATEGLGGDAMRQLAEDAGLNPDALSKGHESAIAASDLNSQSNVRP